MNNVVYRFDVGPKKPPKPTAEYVGAGISSFYVKCSLSPDEELLGCGSSGNSCPAGANGYLFKVGTKKKISFMFFITIEAKNLIFSSFSCEIFRFSQKKQKKICFFFIFRHNFFPAFFHFSVQICVCFLKEEIFLILDAFVHEFLPPPPKFFRFSDEKLPPFSNFSWRKKNFFCEKILPQSFLFVQMIGPLVFFSFFDVFRWTNRMQLPWSCQATRQRERWCPSHFVPTTRTNWPPTVTTGKCSYGTPSHIWSIILRISSEKPLWTVEVG